MHLALRWGLYLFLPIALWLLIAAFGETPRDYPGFSMALWLIFASSLVSSLLPVVVRSSMYADGEWGGGGGLGTFGFTFSINAICFFGLSRILGNEWMFRYCLLTMFVHAAINALHSIIDGKKREAQTIERNRGNRNDFTFKS